MLNFLKSEKSETSTSEPVLDMNTKTLSHDRKQLRWLINNPPADLCKIITITPDMAEAMMERNASEEWKNRPHSERGLLRYARAMKSGNWPLTGEPIIFSKAGNLINGQHRLMACISAGVPFPCAVMFGIDDNAFKFIDIGIVRGAGHIFAIEGVPNYNAISAAARLLFAYKGATNWRGGNVEVENDTLLQFYYRHDRLQESFEYSRALHRELRLAGRWSIFLHYICAEKNRGAADTYFEQISSGVGITSKSSPAFKVRKRLLENALSTSDKLSDAHCAAFIVKGWNAVRENRTLELLKWRTEQSPEECFPRAV